MEKNINKKAYAYTTGSVSALTPTESHSYTYGATTIGGISYGRNDWLDMLAAHDGVGISYDAIGNPTNDGTWTYTWQHGRQLQQMSKTGETVSFEYNEDGLRTKKTSTSTGVTEYILHGKNIVHLTNGTNNLHFYYDGQSRPAIVIYNGTAYGYLYNLQGDVVALVDGTGAKVVEYGYDAWGKPTSKTGTMASSLGKIQPFRYRGYVWDDETELYYLRSRYYYPLWGRFINADSIGSSNCSIYAYCENCPSSCDDESGNMSRGILNKINYFYANGMLGSTQVSTLVLLLNGADYGTACHEIAQLNVARRLELQGYTVSLEYSTSNGEADVVAGRCIWEIKPYATSGQSQLNKYIEATGFDVGFTIGTISGIQVVGNIRMDITSSETEQGVINYKLYLVSAQQLPFFRKTEPRALNPQGITPLLMSPIPVPQLQV